MIFWKFQGFYETIQLSILIVYAKRQVSLGHPYTTNLHSDGDGDGWEYMENNILSVTRLDAIQEDPKLLPEHPQLITAF